MYRRKGFTLIELLVVIAIIALLMAILMPALAKAKRMTKAAMCMAQLKQWGSFFTMYLDDFNGYFMGGRATGTYWFEVLEPYYRNRDLLCCPMANNPKKQAKDGYCNYGVWGPEWYPEGSEHSPNPGVGFYGSYGINEWICHPVFKSGEVPMYGDMKKHWRTSSVKGVSNIPVLADAWWDQAWAEAFDRFPEYPGEWEGFTGDDMAHFCVLRHDGFINILFMDWTVKKVHLRDLWPQRWNRLTDTEDLPTENEYPPWLKKL